MSSVDTVANGAMVSSHLSSSSSPSSSCTMINTSKSWDAETIALLLNKKLYSPPSSIIAEKNNSNGDDASPQSLPAGHIKVTFPPDNKEENNTKCHLTFASPSEMKEIIKSYNGVAIPMTHNYNYYTFTDYHLNEDSNDNSDKVLRYPAPPLHLQLMALPTDEISRRLSSSEGTQNGDKKKKRKKRDRVRDHATLVSNLLSSHFPSKTRPIIHCKGAPLPNNYTDKLLQQLRSLPNSAWPIPAKQRRGVSSGKYLTVRANRPKPPSPKHNLHHDALWNICEEVINTVVTNPKYTALAITFNFRGSPHVDNHDKTHQYVIAVGDFVGGELCTEYNVEGRKEVRIDVNGRVGCIDGRNIHWVNEWSGKERYSIVYYSTNEDDYTEKEKSVEGYLDWMRSMQSC